MSSCVPSEQNELVVRTGLELRLRPLDVKKIGFWKNILRIGFPNSNITTLSGVSTSDVKKAVIIYYSNGSYSDYQRLYHIFWTTTLIKNTFGSYANENPSVASYQTFINIVNEVQKNGDAIVFGMDELMWFPGPKAEPKPQPTPEFPEDEIQNPYGKREEFGVQASPSSAYKLIPTYLLFGSLKTWVLKTHPETQFVNMGPSMGVPEGMMWRIWGWNTLPNEYDTRNADWSQSIIGLKTKAEPEPKADDTKAQLAAIAESLKLLTESVNNLILSA